MIVLKRKSMKYSMALAILSSSLLPAVTANASPVTTTQVTEEQVQELETKIQKLDNDIIESMEKEKLLNEDIKNSRKKIEKIQAELEENKKRYEDHKNVYENRLRAMQERGSSNVMLIAEILLESDGLSDFLNRTYAISQILESDQDLLKGLGEKKDELLKTEKKLNDELKKLEESKKQLTEEQERIKENKKKVEQELNRVKEILRQIEEARKAEEERQRQLAEERQRLERQRMTQTLPPTPFSSPTLQKGNPLNQTFNPAPSSNASDKANIVIANAKKYLGVPYVWGGTTPSGFDCSGLTSYVYRSVGINLPRVSRDQQNFGTRISPHNVQPGDLVFMGSPAYHVGIYIGDGKWLHAPRTGDVVKIASYNPSKFSSASRVLY